MDHRIKHLGDTKDPWVCINWIQFDHSPTQLRGSLLFVGGRKDIRLTIRLIFNCNINVYAVCLLCEESVQFEYYS